MDREPLEIEVGDWALKVTVKDPWVQFEMITETNTSHYMRLPHKDAHRLIEYLSDTLPINANQN